MGSIGNSYWQDEWRDLLRFDNSNTGLTTTLTQIQDGAGNLTGVYISTNKINFDRTQGEFQLDGVALTATAAALNAAAGADDATFVVLNTDGDLPNERVLTGTSNQLNITDNGAGSTVVLSLSSTLVLPGTLTLGGTVSGGGNQINNVIIGTTTPLAGTFTVATANSFVPNSTTVPTNGIYLSAANSPTIAANSAKIATFSATGLAMNTLALSGITTLAMTGALTYGGVTLTANVTGTGKMVLDNNAVLVAPALGTPASGVLTNCTGYPSSSLSGVLATTLGGTGIANNAASTLTISGNFATTLTVSGITGVTLPTSGTLATLAGSEEFTNKTLNASVGKGVWTASGTWTLPAHTLGGTVTMNGQTISGAVVFNAGLSGITTLAGTGAVSGFTTANFSGLITGSSGITFGGGTLSTFVDKTDISSSVTIAGSSTAGTFGFSTRTVTWSRIGNIVFVSIRMNVNAISGTPAGDTLITGLPVASMAIQRQGVSLGVATAIDFDSITYTQIQGYIAAGETQVRLTLTGDNQAFSTLAVTGITTSSQIIMNFSYFV